jgi:hypothetical protein
MRRSATGLTATSSVYCEVDGLPAALDAGGLSNAGAFVITTTPAELDRELDLFLRSDAGEITVQGQVVQVIDVARASREGRAPGFGVLFTHLNDAQRDWLERTRSAHTRPVVRSGVREPEEAPALPSARPSMPPPAVPRESLAAPRPTESSPAGAPRTANPQISPEARNLVRRMREELDELSKLPPWQVLDVEAGCSAAQAKAAFFSASKQFHPHLFARHNSPELDQLVTELFILHKRAFTSLTQSAKARGPKTPSDARRAAPVPARTIPPPAPTADPLDLPLSSPKAPTPVPRSATRPRVTTGEREVPRSERPPPKTLSERPVSPEAQRARAQMMVNDALKDLAASRLEDALKGLQRAFDLDPGYSQAELWLLICQARQAKADDRGLLAVERYARVLKLDPQNREALAAVRAAETGDGSTTKKLFGKLFGASKD